MDLATGGVTDLPITDLASYTPFEDGLETCNNVVIGVKFTVYYSLDPAPSANGAAEGSVTGVDVELTLADVRRAVGTVTQRFGLRHVHTDVDRSDVTSFSGNPGYLPGFPVLAGLKVSDNATGEVAVARIAGGLPLPAADGEGRCAPGSLTAATFGGNVSSACFVELNAGELEALCQGGDPFFVLRGAALANSATATYIDSLLTGDVVAGVWGNSDWRDIRQWVNMTAAVPDPPTWNGATRTCSGVVTGFSYQVRTGVAFAANNLQSKVLHVRPCFAVGTLRFPAAFPNSTDAKFYLDLGATFVPKGDQKKQARSRPVPPLLINLPKDIFYPFVAS